MSFINLSNNKPQVEVSEQNRVLSLGSVLRSFIVHIIKKFLYCNLSVLVVVGFALQSVYQVIRKNALPKFGRLNGIFVGTARHHNCYLRFGRATCRMPSASLPLYHFLHTARMTGIGNKQLGVAVGATEYCLYLAKPQQIGSKHIDIVRQNAVAVAVSRKVEYYTVVGFSLGKQVFRLGYYVASCCIRVCKICNVRRRSSTTSRRFQKRIELFGIAYCIFQVTIYRRTILVVGNGNNHCIGVVVGIHPCASE